MNYIKVPLYIVDNVKRLKYIDMTFWTLEDLKCFYKNKKYKKYVNIIRKYHILY